MLFATVVVGIVALNVAIDIVGYLAYGEAERQSIRLLRWHLRSAKN